MSLLLIVIDDVKKYVPLYADYLTTAAEAAGLTAEELLQQEAEFAEADFMACMPAVTAAADMTTEYTRHLVNLIRYRVFMVKHADTEFERDPLIVQEYKNTREKLDKGRMGAGRFNVTAKDRIFDTGFVESANEEQLPSSVPFQEE
ncbi:hypothetical protein JW777_00705 [bacterium]|nr:hypothetical protein [bacterium]